MPRINCDYNMFEFLFGTIMVGIRSSLITKDGLKNFNRYSNFKFNPKGYDYYYQRFNSMKNSKSKNTYFPKWFLIKVKTNKSEN